METESKMAFSAHQVAEIAGISKNTLLRWLKQGKVPEVCRDRNGWRIFQQEDVDRVCAYAQRTSPPNSFSWNTASRPAGNTRPNTGSEAA